MTPVAVALPDQRIWLRVAARDWANPLDTSWAEARGGRWNPPQSFPTLYLNADVLTAQLQIERLCEGMPFSPEDLSDDAYMLVFLRLPPAQRAADAVTPGGLAALGLPDSYPADGGGHIIEHAVCQLFGMKIREQRLHGVWCRSAASRDGRGRELAWFPNKRSARPLRRAPMPLGQWRYASNWRDFGVSEQPNPE